MIEDCINWGRVMVMIAFTAYAVKYFTENDINMEEDLTVVVTDILSSKYGAWFEVEGYWKGIRTHKNNIKRFQTLKNIIKVSMFVIATLVIVRFCFLLI